MRNGIVLLELLLVIMVMLLLAAIVAPRVGALGDRAAVHTEASHLVEAIDASRAAAIRLDASVTLTLGDSGFRAIARPPSGDSLVAWQSAGPAFADVALRGSGSGIIFGAAGLAIGASNRTLTLTRGSATRSVVLSRFGRVTY